MSDELIDSVLADSHADPVEAENQAEEAVEQESEPGAAESEVAFPRKALNAISYRDKKIGKLREGKERDLQQIQQLHEEIAKLKGSEDLKAENFKQYDDFLEEKILRKHELKERERELSLHQANQQNTDQQWLVERGDALDQASAEVAKSLPDFEALVTKHGKTISGFPADVKRSILEADSSEAIIAFYNLAKEGRLEELAHMTPFQIGVTIAKSQSPLKKPLSNAPAPLSSAKGRGGSKTADAMDADELLKWVYS